MYLSHCKWFSQKCAARKVQKDALNLKIQTSYLKNTIQILRSDNIFDRNQTALKLQKHNNKKIIQQ